MVAVLPRLTAVTSPALLLLAVALVHAGAELNVDAGRGGEPKALGHLDEVEFVDVKDGPETVRGVSLQIRPVTIFGGLKRR